MGTDRNAGFRREARGCEKCGFAYLFELLDDYYPAPNAAFFACDSRRADRRLRPRLVRADRAEDRAGDRPSGAARCWACSFDDGTDHVQTALEWEVRVQGKPVEVNAERDLPASAVADIFPAYDDEEGGVLVVLTPTNHR